MKKITLILAVIALSIITFACSGGNSNNKSSAEKKVATQPITMENLVSEWECVDITDGVTHTKSIAKMQPHFLFNKKNEIFSKMKLPDGSFSSQKVGVYKIEKGKIVSTFFEDKPYLENNKLIIENTSEGNKHIYKKINNGE